jgi:hypothetical protein
MSQDVFQLLWNRDAKPIREAQPSALPIALRFDATTCGWEIKNGKLYHAQLESPDGGIPSELGTLDPWKVRSDFLRIRNHDEMLSFLRATGVFHKREESNRWRMPDLFKAQQGVRQLLQTLPQRWTFGTIGDNRRKRDLGPPNRPHSVCLNKDSHYAIVSTSVTLRALVVSVMIDHVRDARYSFCARADCGTQFRFESRHKRKYCSFECAHVEAVRRHRFKKKSRTRA